MGAISPCERLSDFGQCFQLVTMRRRLRNWCGLLSQPAADCPKLAYREIIEVDPTNCPHRVAILRVIRNFIAVGEDYAVSSSFGQSKERRYLCER
jgi:hypothetical protein